MVIAAIRFASSTLARAHHRRALCLAFALAAIPAEARARCEGIVPQALPSQGPGRSITPEDLVRLRDIGLPDGAILGWPSPLGLSPDGTKAAFLITRADPASNSYCRALAVIDLRVGARPYVIDQGGEPILEVGAYRGLLANIGFPAPVTPSWSPDGRSIAYLRRDEGVTQVWLIPAAGGPARALTRSPVDIEAFAWRPDGMAIIVASRPGRLIERTANAAESLDGYRYDQRFVPSTGPGPRPSAAIPREFLTVEVATGAVSAPTPQERLHLSPETMPGVPPEPQSTTLDGRRAATERSGASPLDPVRLWATTRSGERVACSASQCAGGILGIWWMPDGRSLLYLRREGWARGDMALYRWSPGGRAPRRILKTSDIIDGCVLARLQLVCMRENATTPRRLVLLDVENGRSRLLYDPNPEFAAIRLGTVHRLFWKNDIGLEVRGDLVLPPDFRPGKPVPLVVTQYFSDGFLRGATGDEYPIHAFAANGFAVLSIGRPTFFAAAFPNLKSYEEINAANAQGWGERKSLLSAVMTGVQRVIDAGIADPARIGITGLSDGASTVAYALINTRRFAAAAMSTCCTEPWTVMAYGGIAYADRMRSLGYPAASRADRDFWSPASLTVNAARIDTPILMQLADDEYLLALEAFTALREHRKPVDLYVFPNEHHIKWQPAHRLAAYRRNLDWFGFWLMDRIDPAPSKSGQFDRWRRLRGNVLIDRPGE